MDFQGSTIPKMGDFSAGEAETVERGTSAWSTAAAKTS